MTPSMQMSEVPRGRARNILQRRAYAAQRAMVALERYSSLSLAYAPLQERDRAKYWMQAWTKFAFSRRNTAL